MRVRLRFSNLIPLSYLCTVKKHRGWLVKNVEAFRGPCNRIRALECVYTCIDIHIRTYIYTNTCIYTHTVITDSLRRKRQKDSRAFSTTESGERRKLSLQSIPYAPIAVMLQQAVDGEVVVDRRKGARREEGCSKLENFFPFALHCSLPRCGKRERGWGTGFHELSSLPRAGACGNLVSKAELYGGSFSLVTSRSMRVTKELLFSPRSTDL